MFGRALTIDISVAMIAEFDLQPAHHLLEIDDVGLAGLDDDIGLGGVEGDLALAVEPAAECAEAGDQQDQPLAPPQHADEAQEIDGLRIVGDGARDIDSAAFGRSCEYRHPISDLQRPFILRARSDT